MTQCIAKPRVLIISQDLVGAQMAGPGIRYWELARVLTDSCDVTLAAPKASAAGEPIGWAMAPITLEQPEEIDPLLAEADVLISTGFLLYHYPQLANLRIPWVIDLYIPSPSEGLAYGQNHPLEEQLATHEANCRTLNSFLGKGDFFLCASERQRDMYLGVLAAIGRLNPYIYADEPTLRRLIDVVPFGLKDEAPRHDHAIFKGVQPGITPDDKVILWGGGIWDWLDPLTLIRAVALVVQERSNVRLYFPGTRHPYQERVPDMAMHQRAVTLSDELGLTGKHIFFGGWLPSAERGSYLLEADIGACLHPEGVESHFAFRTRVLDYLWAGLPMLLSEGDVLADLVRDEGLGLVVQPGDVQGLAQSIIALVDEPDARAARSERFERVRQRFYWERVAKPLIRFCRQGRFAADRLAGYHPQGLLDVEQITRLEQQLVSCSEHERQLQYELDESRALAERLAFAKAEVEQKFSADLQLGAERERALQATIQGYENGRVMRLLNALARWRRRI